MAAIETELKTGDVYWCILPSLESLEYDSAPEPPEPWQGVIQIDDRGILWIRQRVPETGEPDHDSNATALPRRDGRDLFATEEEAWTAYRGAMRQRATELYEHAAEALAEGGSCAALFLVIHDRYDPLVLIPYDGTRESTELVDAYARKNQIPRGRLSFDLLSPTPAAQP